MNKSLIEAFFHKSLLLGFSFIATILGIALTIKTYSLLKTS